MDLKDLLVPLFFAAVAAGLTGAASVWPALAPIFIPVAGVFTMAAAIVDPRWEKPWVAK